MKFLVIPGTSFLGPSLLGLPGPGSQGPGELQTVPGARQGSPRGAPGWTELRLAPPMAPEPGGSLGSTKEVLGQDFLGFHWISKDSVRISLGFH